MSKKLLPVRGEKSGMCLVDYLKAVLLQISVISLCLVLTATVTTQDASATTWGPEQEISTDVGTETQYEPLIAAEAGKLHAVWRDLGSGDWDIYYRCFDGTNWQPEQEASVDSGTEGQYDPRVAASGDQVHVLWSDVRDGDYDIYYRHFDGTAWQPYQELSTDSGSEGQRNPSIVAEGDYVYVVWNDGGGGDSDIVFRYFDGTNWQPDQEISTDIGVETQWGPRIAAEGGKLYVVWVDTGDGDNDIYYRHFDGTNWQPEMEVSSDAGAEIQESPVVAVGNGKVHIAWIDQGDGDRDVYYRHFDGTSWHPEQEISTDAGTEMQYNVMIASEDDRAFVIWSDQGDGDEDMYYRYNNGTNWQPEEEFSTDSFAESQPRGSIAVEDGTVHIVWDDRGGGDPDIYYRSGAEDITPPESSADSISPYWRSTSTFSVGWTATDDFGLVDIYMYYRYSSDNSSWLDWQELAHDNTISGTSDAGSFQFESPRGEGYYEFYTVANDASGNPETAPTVADAIVSVDTTAPAVESVAPVDGATGTETGTNIIVTFSERMDQTATEDAFHLRTDSTEVVGTFSWSSDGKTMTFDPTEDLQEKKTYQISVTTTAEDLAGNNLATAQETSFVTAETVDQVGSEFLLVVVLLVVVIVIATVIALIAMKMRGRPPVEAVAPPEETVPEIPEEA